ncbi:rhamnan synthesis F family protein [Polynucleobacter sp. HIN6]|uniref:rhamnan synthesis F family protein n=1 Tax=Polynucleobacter sp. HIN6 TaxID=3047865 RepID=UPI0025742D81|nr:rhamnan synthesis F family protein [Polynucleobacter sp. HIN6]
MSKFIKKVRETLVFQVKENIGIVGEIDVDLETILIISHEASRTGAPVLSLNLVREFSKKFNVVVVLLGPGVLTNSFKRVSAVYVQLINQKIVPRIFIQKKITKLTKRFNFKFAIVNSIESRVVLDGLSQNSVPTITLIHEFASYTRPEDAFPAALFWSSEVVFSASIVRENAFLTYPHLSARSTHIIPQGRCLLPIDDLSQIDIEQECIRIRSLMRPKDLDPHTKIILGAGFVQMRKGIDLFVECATRVVGSPGGEKCRFVWIGKGYDPENDIAYSVYIKDQIERAGLQKYIFFIDETPAIEAAYEEADLFLLSSRLDPLPNVAIEVMSYGVPVLCFNKTTGIADFLIESGLEEVCVAQYIDTAEMAQKIISLLNSESLYQATAQQCQQAASQYFDMKTYVAKLEQLGENAKAQMEQDKLDGQTIIESGLLKEGFGIQRLGNDKRFNVSAFLLSWKNGMGRRKPHPGFHPGIYREQHGLASPNVDPFADYLRAGRPKGPWSYPVITSQTNRRLPALPQNKRVALHIHAYYPELFASIIDALLSNQIRPDLFVSVPDQQGKEKVMYELRRYQGVKHDIRVVPNRGRDIGPFLTEFGKDFLEGYDFVGHIHTKKSVDIKDAQTGDVWYRFALANLLGIKQHPMADVILTEFNINSTLGIVFPDDPNIVGWDKNKEHAKPIAKRMGIETLPENFLFPVGAMFWARTKALMPFFNLNLDWEDYPAEPLPYDGSTLHAIERLLGFPAKGYQVATSYVQGVMR